MHLDPKTILAALNPTQPPEALFASIVCYTIALLTLVGLLMQKEGSTRDTVFLSIVIMSCLIDKIAATSIPSVRDSVPGLTHNSFGIFMIRVTMFVFPMIVAGSTKNEKSRPLLIGVGLLGGAYMFARWFFEIRPQ